MGVVESKTHGHGQGEGRGWCWFLMAGYADLPGGGFKSRWSSRLVGTGTLLGHVYLSVGGGRALVGKADRFLGGGECFAGDRGAAGAWLSLVVLDGQTANAFPSMPNDEC